MPAPNGHCRLACSLKRAFPGLPLIVLTAWAWTPRRAPPGNERGIVALVIGLGLGVVLLPPCLIAMCLPIFRQAASGDG